MLYLFKVRTHLETFSAYLHIKDKIIEMYKRTILRLLTLEKFRTGINLRKMNDKHARTFIFYQYILICIYIYKYI